MPPCTGPVDNARSQSQHSMLPIKMSLAMRLLLSGYLRGQPTRIRKLVRLLCWHGAQDRKYQA